MRSEQARPTDLLFVTAGGIVWAVRFSVVYAVTAMACASGWAEAPLFGVRAVDWVIVTSTALALIAIAAVVSLVWQRSERRADRTAPMTAIDASALGVALLSALAILWESLVIALPACS